MKNPFLAVAVWVVLTLLALAYAGFDGWTWVKVADITDAGISELGRNGKNVHPGGLYMDDAYFWLGYAREIGSGKTWRVRETKADNAPYGRPVQWSQSASWMLVALGKARQLLTGEAWTAALERAAILQGPLQFVLLAAGLSSILFMRVGAIPAGLFSLYLATQPDISWMFNPLRPGHRGLQCFFGICFLAGLAMSGAGWTRTESGTSGRRFAWVKPLELPGYSGARNWFVLSGVCAGMGLWISAAVDGAMLLAAFGASFILAAACGSRNTKGAQVHPELWRLWGWTTGLISLFFYLLEYFPSHLRIHLEVNSPVYSAMAVLMGESVCQVLKARFGQKTRRKWHVMLGLLCAFLVALVPLGILFGPTEWHAIRDLQTGRVPHLIKETRSFAASVGKDYLQLYFQTFGILPAFMVLAAFGVFARLRVQERTALLLAMLPAYGLFALACIQYRFFGLHAMLSVWLAVLTGAVAWRWSGEHWKVRRPAWIAGALVVLLLLQPAIFAKTKIQTFRAILQPGAAPVEALALTAIAKQTALAFREAAGPGARVVAEADMVPYLFYFTDATGVASTYWENRDGLHAQTAFMNDEDGGTARKIARERGLTYLIFSTLIPPSKTYSFVGRGQNGSALGGETLAMKLDRSELAFPPWISSTPRLDRINMAVYRYNDYEISSPWRIYQLEP